MEMTSAAIDLRILEALSLCATDSTRYYIHGVCLEIEARAMTYVATDGHRAIAHRVEHAEGAEDNTLLGRFIIPAANCKPFKYTKRAPTDAVIRGDAERLSIDYAGQSVSFCPVEGTYPDWRRVIPSAPISGQIAQFNAKYLLDFQKIGEMLDLGGTPVVGHNGDAPAFVTWDTEPTNTVAVLMPIRSRDMSDYTPPAWLRAA
jgi:hypothetical protein